MPNHPKTNKSSKIRVSSSKYQSSQHLFKPSQHGPILLRIPSELLSNCTSFLEPQALFVLSLCNRQLYEHVSNDTTWHGAFMSCFYGIGPNDVTFPPEAIMLRRFEPTWKREFIHRYSMLQRLARSRDATISHAPCFSDISTIYFLDKDQALLSASVQYGVVARSFPVTGKILKGYLTASSPLLGLGNPNAEFASNVLSIAMGPVASPTGACVLWGCQSGEVALTCSPRVMDGVRTQTRYYRCSVTDEHAHPVTHAVCVSTGFWTTADTFGRVKFWEGSSKSLQCLWTSNEDKMEPCLQLRAVIGVGRAGVIVALYKSGKIVIWRGFNGDISQWNPKTIQIHEFTLDYSSNTPLLSSRPESLMTLFVDPLSTQQHITIGVNHQLGVQASFLRWEVDFTPTSPRAESVPYVDNQLDALTCLAPSFTDSPEETAFVLGGDSSGKIAVWRWDVEVSQTEVRSFRRIQAHDDGSLCSIAMNGTVIASGSTGGSVALHCAATLSPIRVFSPGRSNREAGTDAVSQIILREHILLWNMGNKVFCWPVGALTKSSKSRNKHKSKSWMKSSAKGIDVQELKADIKESSKMLSYEQARIRTTTQRRQDQNKVLDDLGLSEAEAVNYALMLSLETAPSYLIDQTQPEEGMFLEDERIHRTSTTQSPASPRSLTPLSQSSSFPNSYSSTPSSSTDQSYSISQNAISSPQALESVPSGIAVNLASQQISQPDMSSFPAISTSFSHRPSQLNWSRIMRASSHPGDKTIRSSLSTADPQAAPKVPKTVSLDDGSEEMDDDLRHALQLSLLDVNRPVEE